MAVLSFGGTQVPDDALHSGTRGIAQKFKHAGVTDAQY